MIFILVAIYWSSGNGGPQASVSNLWELGFLPSWLYWVYVCISYCDVLIWGLELVGITAAEAENPKVSIPKAT